MHIHTYIHIHIWCAQPAASMFADVYVGVKTHLCNIHTCPYTSAQNTWKVHVTLTAKNTHIYIPTHIRVHIHMHMKTHAHAWHHPHAEALILRPTIYAQICIHVHIHMCISAWMYKYIHTCISSVTYIYTCLHTYTYTHIHIYTHTHTKCTYERTQARLERQRSSERARNRCRERKLCMSLLFDAIKPHFAPSMQGLQCTHFLKHPYPSTLHPLFPTYPKQFVDCGQVQF